MRKPPSCSNVMLTEAACKWHQDCPRFFVLVERDVQRGVITRTNCEWQ
jgi:hypothetical protein